MVPLLLNGALLISALPVTPRNLRPRTERTSPAICSPSSPAKTPYQQRLSSLYDVGGGELVAQFKRSESLRQMCRRLNRSEEEKQQDREKARITY